MTAQPIRRPVTASTAASHTGTLSEQSVGRGCAVLCGVSAEVVVVVEVRGKVVLVVRLGKLLTFVKM